jgi:hypothetical protein
MEHKHFDEAALHEELEFQLFIQQLDRDRRLQVFKTAKIILGFTLLAGLTIVFPLLLQRLIVMTFGV